mmetsp:Transcript_15006/g.34790  ORF Transcript_15006/g.34790 Transcript_15006/m.34790 type:complete len:708 (+) Transcript_15006:128-2251(+)
MSQTLLVDDTHKSVHSKCDRIGKWKKNCDGDIYQIHTSDSDKLSPGTGIALFSREQNLVPNPIFEGMNHRQHQQYQQRHQNITATNNTCGNNDNDSNNLTAIANQSSLSHFNLNNSAPSMLVPNSNHNSSYSQAQQVQGNASSTSCQPSTPAMSNNSAWLQHMILNPINPLHNNPVSTGNDLVENVRNQGNAISPQQQYQGNSDGSVDDYVHRHHGSSNQAEDTKVGASAKQEQWNQSTSFQTQQEQHQQGLQLNQFLSLQQQRSFNEAIPQIQLPVARETQQLQQQQSMASSNVNPPPTSSLQQQPQQQQQLLQQQQQLLLLTLLIQQNNTNNSNVKVDIPALSNVLASPEGVRLLNSLLLEQQLQSLQENQIQQQKLQSVSSGPVPSSSSSGFDQLTQLSLPGIDEDVLSNQHSSLLSQHSQQMQPQPQPQQLSGMQIPSMPILNSTLPSSLEPDTQGKIGDLSFGSTAINQHYPSTTDDHSIANTSIVSTRYGISLQNLSMSVDPLSSGSKIEMDSVGFLRKNDRQNESSNIGKTNTRKSQFPRVLYCDSDDAILGEYQTLLRQQLELFEADSHDVINGTFRQGRTTPIRLGQIGLRCKHCAKAPLSVRTKGSVYFSQTIKGMYQIGQNMSKVHLCERCTRIPPDIKKRMITLRNRRHRASGGRAYWIRHLREMGINEDGTVLRAYPLQERKASIDGKKAAKKK